MNISGHWSMGKIQHYAAQKAAKSKGTEEFVSKTVSTPKTHIVYIKTDDMLYSGGNGTGLSYYIKYAPDSTEEDPTVIAKGVDENGNAFEQTIHINKIDPHCATLVEMRALEAYLNVDKNGGLSSLPPDTGKMGLHDRRNFMDMFRKQIRDMGTLKERQLMSYYQYSMQMYEEFFNKNTQNEKNWLQYLSYASKVYDHSDSQPAFVRK